MFYAQGLEPIWRLRNNKCLVEKQEGMPLSGILAVLQQINLIVYDLKIIPNSITLKFYSCQRLLGFFWGDFFFWEGLSSGCHVANGGGKKVDLKTLLILFEKLSCIFFYTPTIYSKLNRRLFKVEQTLICHCIREAFCCFCLCFN